LEHVSIAQADVDEDDDRRIALYRYIINLCESGEQAPSALQKAGLAYLHSSWVKTARSGSQGIELWTKR
jgi:hypothetical protein